MLRIGLTGGIGAGKSTALARFSELGAHPIDHDVLARQAVAPGAAALADIAREFGDRLIVDGELDRGALAAVVFADDHARQRLNDIVHPYVKAAAKAADKRARAQGVQVVVHDIPLLYETGQGESFDLVVTVEAPLEVRIRRLVEGRGMSRDQALGRIAAQASDRERREISDAVLDGSGSVDRLRDAVDEFWQAHVPAEVAAGGPSNATV